MKMTKSTQQGMLNGFLDQGCRFTGELEFEDTLRLDGVFRGKIVSKRELIVGESGDFDGEIEVGRVSINGLVRGTVRARERIEIHPGGRVEATLITPVLVVEEGSVVEGNVIMDLDGKGSRPDVKETDGKVVELSGKKRREEEELRQKR